jgi:hypothetical protein
LGKHIHVGMVFDGQSMIIHFLNFAGWDMKNTVQHLQRHHFVELRNPRVIQGYQDMARLPARLNAMEMASRHF